MRTIRFYSDSGVVAPTTRSPACYRLYDFDALLRLELLRTLRELGVDLPTVRRVLDRELSVAEVAAAHADALDVEIRVLQLRRSVLRAVARGGSWSATRSSGPGCAGRPGSRPPGARSASRTRWARN
ncbi:MerR family transcriptional regulator [Streptomyces sp. 2132.2]|uniref:MerR family transcriptional regulator n=1 Tax=Streptomyces sp. 2132.2 TaxID=2485161 RepID=UPI0037DA25B4